MTFTSAPRLSGSASSSTDNGANTDTGMGTIARLLDAFVKGGDALACSAAARAAALAAGDLGIWIHVCPAADWAAQLATLARRIDEAADRAEALRRYPLLGVPFAVKDNIDIAGQPTTAGCPAFSHIAQTSATVVRRLLDAGALWVGKTNLDQFATGLVGTRSPYGRPASVADPRRISGGSSSGSAVAVARGMVPFALGTDTAGSGRVPAGFNGLVGLKPTPGRVSTAGVVPACRSVDCVSILAHTVADAAHVLAVLEGPDAADAYSAFAVGRARWPGRLRVGVPRQPRVDVASGYAAAWDAAVERARAQGHTLIDTDLTLLFEVAALLYDGPWLAERHAACRAVFDQRPDAMDATVRQVIAGAIGFSATDTFAAQHKLRALKARLAALWDGIDVLLVPTAPLHPTFAEVDADPVGVNAVLGTYTNFVNLLGWCALALPSSLTAAGLPFGVTLIAPAGCDAALADAGQRWGLDAAASSKAIGAAPPPWLRTPASEAVLPLAVVGAHLSGLPLNGQLRERGAVLLQATATAPHYRLHALPGAVPPKPGLVRAGDGGAAIAVEVWAMPLAAVGSLLALIPPPLGLGSIELEDGRHVHGFLCEADAVQGAQDITAFGGWRAYLASLAAKTSH